MFNRTMRVWSNRVLKPILLSVICAIIGGASFAAPSTEGIQIYQKNVHLSPEHKQKLADDITRYQNADNLWDVLREEFALPHYEDSPAVQEKIEWFMNNQDFLLRSATRAAPYLYYILQQVHTRHLPAELVLLPIIESGYNPFNRSSVGAAGIWQLMPGTATGLGIKQNSLYDGRRDVIASTHAALNYLSYLESFFEGNWLLAIAAYNTGEGNVLTAIRKNIRDGRPTDFWYLPVAQETRDYVPSLLALAVIISHPERYPVYFPPVRNAPYLAQVDVGKQIDLNYAASLAGISYRKLIQLNPAFNRTSTSTVSMSGPSKLVLPIENVEQFAENLSRSPLTQRIYWLHYKVKSGDSLVTIAKKFNTTPDELKKMNHLSKNGLGHGTDILIPHTEISNGTAPIEIAEADTNESFQPKVLVSKKKVSNALAAPYREINFSKISGKYILHPGDTIYMVRSMDTLDNIANRFHIHPQTLVAINQLAGGRLTPGKQIIIPTHAPLDDEMSDSNSNDTALQPGDTIYMVRRGDTIDTIASRFHTSASAIRVANLMNDNALQEGDRLVVPTHLQG